MVDKAYVRKCCDERLPPDEIFIDKCCAVADCVQRHSGADPGDLFALYLAPTPAVSVNAYLYASKLIYADNMAQDTDGRFVNLRIDMPVLFLYYGNIKAD